MTALGRLVPVASRSAGRISCNLRSERMQTGGHVERNFACSGASAAELGPLAAGKGLGLKFFGNPDGVPGAFVAVGEHPHFSALKQALFNLSENSRSALADHTASTPLGRRDLAQALRPPAEYSQLLAFWVRPSGPLSTSSMIASKPCGSTCSTLAIRITCEGRAAGARPSLPTALDSTRPPPALVRRPRLRRSCPNI
jgi:hypothetical protein